MMSFLFGALKFLPKFVFDFLLGRYKEKKQKKRTLERFYLILTDVRDRALDGLRTLAAEHNRRNDPFVRNGRKWSEYGPVASPFKVDFFSLRQLFESQYEDFTPEQRDGITQILQLADDYNALLDGLRLLDGKSYNEYEWGFAISPAGTLASVIYLADKLALLRERFFIPAPETATSAVEKVFAGYKIHMHEVVFEEVS